MVLARLDTNSCNTAISSKTYTRSSLTTNGLCWSRIRTRALGNSLRQRRTYVVGARGMLRPQSLNHAGSQPTYRIQDGP
jgi:hypothetical protein